MRSPQFAQSKGIQDGLEFWDSIRWLRIPGTRFQSLSVELEFPILIVSGIPDPLSPVSNSHFTSKHFPCSLTWSHTVETQIQGRSRRRQRRLRVNSSLRTDSRSLTMDPWKAEEYFAVACSITSSLRVFSRAVTATKCTNRYCYIL